MKYITLYTFRELYDARYRTQTIAAAVENIVAKTMALDCTKDEAKDEAKDEELHTRAKFKLLSLLTDIETHYTVQGHHVPL